MEHRTSHLGTSPQDRVLSKKEPTWQESQQDLFLFTPLSKGMSGVIKPCNSSRQCGTTVAGALGQWGFGDLTLRVRVGNSALLVNSISQARAAPVE